MGEKETDNILVSACLLEVHCRYNEEGVMDDTHGVCPYQAQVIGWWGLSSVFLPTIGH